MLQSKRNSLWNVPFSTGQILDNTNFVEKVGNVRLNAANSCARLFQD